MWNAWGEDECVQVFCGKARRKENTSNTEARWDDDIKVDI
jgi:hypothetical protein